MCIDGQWACPPEDVGCVSGYVNFLEAWRKRSHPEHQHMQQWGEKHFQSELFSVPQVNAALALSISLEQVQTYDATRLCFLLSGECPGSFSIWQGLAGKSVRKNVMTPNRRQAALNICKGRFEAASRTLTESFKKSHAARLTIGFERLGQASVLLGELGQVTTAQFADGAYALAEAYALCFLNMDQDEWTVLKSFYQDLYLVFNPEPRR